MSLKENLIKARSHIIVMLGILIAGGIIVVLEITNFKSGFDNKQIGNKISIIEKTASIKPVPSSELSEQELQYAKIAWNFFKNNFIPETGMVNSADNYNASTMWDTGSYLMGLISAYKLGIIDKIEFDNRLSKLLTSMSKLPLFDNELPNKSYNTISLEMVDYNNNKSPRGIGWSAIDVARLFVPFHIIAWSYPEHSREVEQVINKWNFKNMSKDGYLFSAAVDSNNKSAYFQEGRLGYEEYTARSFVLLGVDALNALTYVDYLKYIDIYGIKVPVDSREYTEFGAHNYVVSEPYILDCIEFGFDETNQEFAFRVYKAQELRWEQTDTLTAVSEDNIDSPPYFVYNTVYTSGKVWNCITESGDDASKFKSLSTKAAFGWEVIYSTDYTNKLIDKIKNNYDEERGWYSGIYEINNIPNKSITCNTNAIILESLAYKKFGRFLNILKTQ